MEILNININDLDDALAYIQVLKKENADLKEFVIDFQENVKIKPVLRISLELDVMSVLMVNGGMIIVLIYVVKIVS